MTLSKKFLSSVLSIVLMILTISTNVFADEYSDSEMKIKYGSLYDYVFENYSVHVKVGKDNILDITEEIDADFFNPKHGIFREIPLYNSVRRLDGTYNENNVEITDITCSDNYTKSVENKNLVLKIGNANTTVTGEKHYTISYKYNLGRDPVKDKDELYFNIIGTQMQAPIYHVDFNIEMPDSFDKSKLGFSLGSKGSVGYSNKLSWEVNGNTITGHADELKAYEGITVRLELPEGYFSEAKMVFDKTSFIALMLMLLFTAVAFAMYKYSANANERIQPVEFYPPDGMNSLKMALIKNGQVVNKDVISLLPYMASKGYITIKENDRGEFSFIKNKDYFGEDRAEKEFMDGLFRGMDAVPLSSVYLENDSYAHEVREWQLKNKFYKTAEHIAYICNQDRNFYYHKGFKIAYNILMVLFVIVCLFMPIVHTTNWSNLLLGSNFLSSVIILMIFCPTIILKMSTTKKGRIIVKSIISGLLFFMFSAKQNLFPSQKLTAQVGCIVLFLLLMLGDYVENLMTFEGKRMLGRVEGFERFLRMAEEPQLKTLARENPEYFFDIFPYAYVLGISNVWVKKFETILTKDPDWYYGNTHYHHHYHYYYMNRMMNNCNSTMTSTPSSSSAGEFSGGGGFSGGGSSGGGSGGGGGGAW